MTDFIFLRKCHYFCSVAETFKFQGKSLHPKEAIFPKESNFHKLSVLSPKIETFSKYCASKFDLKSSSLFFQPRIFLTGISKLSVAGQTIESSIDRLKVDEYSGVSPKRSRPVIGRLVCYEFLLKRNSCFGNLC